MKESIILAVLLFAATIIALLSLCAAVRRLKDATEELHKAYIDEAETLDDMAGLLEGLFDVTNPRQRRKCAHCTHVRQCVYTGKLPESDTVCECFDRREEYADY